jgi:hypothetical protein
MPHDPARIADTKSWLARAVGDIAAAERLLKPPALFGTAVFHCQQAAEKRSRDFSRGMISLFARPIISKSLVKPVSRSTLICERQSIEQSH